jgi:signal transduction histidine kinase
LGNKRDGGLYTQEEIEIARASGERLIDTQASAAIAQRLMTLQRQRLTETQLLDRRTRRVLHDDVLPRLHTAMLTLSNSELCPNGASSDTVTQLADLHRQISDLLHQMPPSTAPTVTKLGLIGALHQLVDDELARDLDGVTWHVEPEVEQAAQTIPSLTGEVLFYAAREAIRNAARYGRGEDATRPLHLHVEITWRDHSPPSTCGLEILIEDDGVGLGSTKNSSEGSGQGLALHSTMMAVVGGTLDVESLPNTYTRVTLRLPQAALETLTLPI